MSTDVESVRKTGRPVVREASARPPVGRILRQGCLVALLATVIAAFTVTYAPLVEIAAGSGLLYLLTLRRLRIDAAVFDQTDDGPWYVKTTCSWFGLVLYTRTHPRADVRIAARYRPTAETPSGTGFGEKHWKAVEIGDEQEFFSPFEILAFGHKRLVRLMEDTL